MHVTGRGKLYWPEAEADLIKFDGTGNRAVAIDCKETKRVDHGIRKQSGCYRL